MAEKTSDSAATPAAQDPAAATPAAQNPAGPVKGKGDTSVSGTTETFPKANGDPQAPNGLAAAAEQTNASTPATETKPVNDVPVSDAVSNENAVEQFTGQHTQETESFIGRIDDWVMRNYDEVVESGQRTWTDIEQTAHRMDDRLLAAFARKRAADNGESVAPATAASGKTTR